MNKLKTLTLLEVVAKVCIGIAALLVIVSLFIHFLDIYVFRDSLLIGTPLLLLSFIFYSAVKIFKNKVLKKPIRNWVVLLIVLGVILIGLVVLFGMVMSAVSR